MKNAKRVGIIFLVFGLSLFLATFLRNSSSKNVNTAGETMSPDQWSMHSNFLLAPRDITITIQSNSTIDLYLLDEQGIATWNKTKKITPIWEFVNIADETVTVENMKRCGYSVLVHNNQNSSTAIKISISMYGFERDLLFASITLTVIGMIFIGMNVIISRKK